MEENNVDSPKIGQNTPKLSQRQLKAIPIFLESNSLIEVCKRANIGTSTYYRWMANPRFKEALQEARGNLYDASFEKLKLSFQKAADTLISLLENPQVWVKLRASERILETCFRLKELEEIESRLSSLERVIWEKKVFR